MRRRLAALGIVPGAVARCRGGMPLGGPLLLEIRGALTALRRRDAAMVRVAVNVEEATAGAAPLPPAPGGVGVDES